MACGPAFQSLRHLGRPDLAWDYLLMGSGVDKPGFAWVTLAQSLQQSEDFDADAIFLGHGITAPEFGWDDYKDVDVKGKVVVVFTNEPPSDDQARTRRVRLSSVTIEANARYWGAASDVPSEAMTVGLRSLLAARRIVLVVSGEGKHEIVREVVDGPVGPEVPASYLQGAEGDVTVVVDRAAWGSERAPQGR